jgi:serine/threonine protein kinase
MAELFIARQEAAGGFEKDLVLKMLQEKYASNPRVVGMFLDEARLAAKLNHQNIVHVYDVNEADGVRYIAMEYIHGETVTDIVRRAIARGGFLPLEHAVQIVADAAAGLGYAHERRDAEGRAARIIHRDVSPSNIIVTYEGVTKIVDFGIARVQDQIREESGMRPGKVSYMSPEQTRGGPVDERSDIFSLGILLYEITVGRRLFRGAPAEVIKKICEEQIPPPTYVRRLYPPGLELIVMKALEKRPTERHQSAVELQHELQEFLEEAGLKSGPRRISQYMKELFADDSEAAATAAAVPDRIEPLGATGSSGRSTADDELEELDFDRRAPLVARVQPRLEPSSGASGEGEGEGSQPVRSLTEPLPDRGIPAPTSGPGRGVSALLSASAGEASIEAPDDVAVLPTPSRPEQDSLSLESSLDVSLDPSLDTPARHASALTWLVLLVLVGAGMVVFLGTR